MNHYTFRRPSLDLNSIFHHFFRKLKEKLDYSPYLIWPSFKLRPLEAGFCICWHILISFILYNKPNESGETCDLDQRSHRNFCSTQDRRIIHVRQLFLRGLEEQSRTMINYYDFLLVAKKLNFRFEQSSHLMELRKYFFAHKNMLSNKKLAGLLCVDDETLKEVRNDFVPSKMYRWEYPRIIRLSVEGRIEAIKEATNEDEEGKGWLTQPSTQKQKKMLKNTPEKQKIRSALKTDLKVRSTNKNWQ